MNRKLTKQEKEWLIYGLNTLRTGKYYGGGWWIDEKTGKHMPLDKPIDPQFWLDQIDDLRVVYKCKCGDKRCHTVEFQHFEPGKSIMLVCYYTEDGRILFINYHEETGKLTELEII